MKIAVVFEPDPSLGFDPLDHAKMPRRMGEFIDATKSDVILVWREFDDQFEDGVRTHVVGSGIWENVTPDQFADAIAYLSDLPEGEDD